MRCTVWMVPSIPAGFRIMNSGIKAYPTGADGTWTPLTADAEGHSRSFGDRCDA